MNISIGNLSGGNANISSMISQLVAQRTSSLNTLLDQKTSIENSLTMLQYAGMGSINNSYSSQISSLQDTLDRLRNQYTINENKLNTINSLNNSYKKTISTLDDYIESLKNPTSSEIATTGTSSNNSVAGVTITGSPTPQRLDLTVTQLATCSTLTSSKISGTAVTGNTKITDLFAGVYNSATNTVVSTRTDLAEDMKLSEIGITSGAFKLGARIIRVSENETLGSLIDKINADSNYTAKIDAVTGQFSISATAGNSIAITNAVGDLNISGDLTTTTKLSDIGVKKGVYFVGDSQVDVTENDTIGTLIDKIEANGYVASLQTDVSNPSAKVLSITDGSGNAVATEATNFASLAGFTVSEGDFKINGTTFNINSNTTIDDLLYQINLATTDGVGAQFKDGKIILTASKTGAVDITVEKGSSNFTNAIGFTQGGTMNLGNYVVGSEGSFSTLKGISDTVTLADTAKADGSGAFKTGNFVLSYTKIDASGRATGEELSTVITINDGDTVADIIEKIKTQTSQTYTDSDGNTQTNYLQAEVVDGYFQIRQTTKGSGYNISVRQGSSDFTAYVGMTELTGGGFAVEGSSTKFTGVCAVTSDMTFTEGSFTIIASAANSPSTMQKVTIDVANGETLDSVINKINSSGLAITASMVEQEDGTYRLQLSHNNYGANYSISVEAGSTDFTNKVGFTATTTIGTSTTETYSTLTGTATGQDEIVNAQYLDGNFVIRTNKLSEDGKTASSEIVSATINVTADMNLGDVLDLIDSAKYTDEHGNQVDMGLRASLTADGRVQIKQIYGGEGFDIQVEAGSSSFTNDVGLTGSVFVGGTVNGATTSYIIAGNAYDGTFEEGSFIVATNKANDDGSASDEMISKEITIESGKTLEEQLDSINSQLAEIGLTAEIVDGKLKISQTHTGAGYDINIESGDTDFTEKLGLTTTVSNKVSTDETSAYLQANVNWDDIDFSTLKSGEFTVTTNAVDANGNATGEVLAKTVTIDASLNKDDLLVSLNTQLSSIGLSATIEDGKLTIRQNNSGAGFDIKVVTGTTNFTELSGLTTSVSSDVSTEATSSMIVGTTTIESDGKADCDFGLGTFKVTVTNPDGAISELVVECSYGDTVVDIAQKINNASIGVTAYINTDGNFVIESNNAGAGYDITVEAGSSDFTEWAGLTSSVTVGTSDIATVTTLTGQADDLTNDTTFTAGSFIITTSALTSDGTSVGTGTVSITIDVIEGETLANVLDKINAQGEAIGITAELKDGKVVISQVNNGAFDISITSGATDFTSKVGLTSEVIVGESTLGVQSSLTGANSVASTYKHTYQASKALSLSLDKIAGTDFASSGRINLVIMDGNNVVYQQYINYQNGESAGDILNRVITSINESGKGTASLDGDNIVIEGMSSANSKILLDDTSGNFVQEMGLTKIKKTEAECAALGYTLVGTANQLKSALQANCQKIVLVNDINFSSFAITEPLLENFTGTIDGNGYSLLDVELTVGAPLFGTIEGGTIKNLGFENVTCGTNLVTSVLSQTLVNSYVDNIFFNNVQISNINVAGGFGLVASDMIGSKLSNVSVLNSYISVNNLDNSNCGLLVGSSTVYDSQLSVIDTFVIDNVSFLADGGSDASALVVGNAYGTDITNGHINITLLEDHEYLVGTADACVIDKIAIFGASSLSSIAFYESGSNYIGEVALSSSDSNYGRLYAELLETGKICFSNRSGSVFTTYSDEMTRLIKSNPNSTVGTPEFSTGNFIITTINDGVENRTIIEVTDSDKTIESVLAKINSAGLGITASLNAENKVVLTADESGADFNIIVESGTSDFLEYVGLASESVEIGTHIEDTKSTLTSLTTIGFTAYYDPDTDATSFTYDVTVSAGSFKINGVTIDFTENMTLDQAVNVINSYSSQTGVVARFEKEYEDSSTGVANLVLESTTVGKDTIYVEGGTSNFGEITGLTSKSVGGGVALGTEGTKTAIVGSQAVKTQFMTESEAIAAGYTIVKTIDDLRAMDGSSGKFMLMNDIDLSSIYDFYINSFSGELDGNGFTLSNSTSGRGLFRTLTGTVKNLTLDNFNVLPPEELAQSESAGILANSATNAIVSNVIIKNSRVSVSTSSDMGQAVGALFGSYYATVYSTDPQISDVVIKNTSVTGDSDVGGLIGQAHGEQNLNMKDLWVDVELDTFASNGSNLNIGGLIGHNSVTTVNVSNAYVNTTGDFSSVTPASIGALFGYSSCLDTGDANDVYVDSTMGATKLIGQRSDSDYFRLSAVYYSIENITDATSDFSNGSEFADGVTSKEVQRLAQQNMSFVNSGITQISAGTVNINGTNISFEQDCTINEAIKIINAKSSTTGVTASIIDGKVNLVSSSSFSVTEGTSDFVEKTGVAGYTIAKGDAIYDTTSYTIVDPLKMTSESSEISNYTQIRTADEFMTLLAENPSGHYVLMNDIDFSEIDINDYAEILSFSGTIEGNGYSIKNYTSEDGYALIESTASGAIIRNLTLDGFSVSGGSSQEGSATLVATVNGVATFDNIVLKNSTVEASYAAGLVGQIYSENEIVTFNNVKIEDTVTIKGEVSASGLIDYISSCGSLVLKNITTEATLTSDGTVQGLVETNDSDYTYIKNVRVGGDFTYSSGASGLVYYDTSGSSLTIEDTYVYANFNSPLIESSALIGSTSANYVTVNDTYYTSSSATSDIGVCTSTLDDPDTTLAGITGSTNVAGAYRVNETSVPTGYTKITTAAQLQSLITADLDGKFILMNDIDLSGVDWTPINNFKGVLDGNGYSIKNLTYSTSSIVNCGLFGTVNGAEFRNLTLDGFNVSSTASTGYVGALVGAANGGLIVENVKVTNSTITSNAYTSGLVARLYTSSSNDVYMFDNIDITDTVTVNGARSAGMISTFVAGDVNDSLIITNSKSSAFVTTTNSTAPTGQIIGYAKGSTYINNVYTGGQIEGGKYHGAVVGRLYSGNILSVTNAHVNTNIGAEPTSGIIGVILGYGTATYTNNNKFNSSLASAYSDTTGAESVTVSQLTANKFVGRDIHNTKLTGMIFCYDETGVGYSAGNISSYSLEELADRINSASAVDGVSAYYNEGVLKIFGLSQLRMGSNYLVNQSSANKRSSVSGLDRDTQLSGLTSGTLSLNSGAKSISVNSTDTIGDIMDKLSAKSINSWFDTSGRLVIDGIVGDISTTNFEELLGFDNTDTTVANNSTTHTYETLTGCNTVTGNEILNAGSFTLLIGGRSQSITVNEGETVNTILKRINESGFGISASIENGKVVLTSTDKDSYEHIAFKEVSGNFGAITGLTTIDGNGAVSIVGSEGTHTTVTGSKKVNAGMSIEEAIAAGYTIVRTEEDLRAMDGSSDKFFLANDIVLSTSCDSVITVFGGTFDGNGHTISAGYNVDVYTLFDTLRGDANICNLNLTLCNTGSAQGTYDGILANSAWGTDIKLSNIAINGGTAFAISDTGSSAGALIGWADVDSLTIDNVKISGSTIVDSEYKGALVGTVEAETINISNVVIDDCEFYTDTTEPISAAGLIGHIIYSGSMDCMVSIENVYTDIAGSDYNVLVGQTDGYAIITSSNIYINGENREDSSNIFFVDPSSGIDVSYDIYCTNNLELVNVGGTVTYQSSITEYQKNKCYSDSRAEVTRGTIKINGQEITLSGGTLQEALEEINAKSSQTGVTASYQDGKVTLTNVEAGAKAINIEEGTSNFVQLTGIAGYNLDGYTTETVNSSTVYKGAISGLTADTTLGDLTGNDFIDIVNPNVSVVIWDSNTTVRSVLTALGGYLDEDGRACFTNNNYSKSDEIAKLLGFKSVSVANTAECVMGNDRIASSVVGANNITMDTVVSAGDFYINYGNESMKVTVGEGQTVADIATLVNFTNSNLVLELQGNKVVIRENTEFTSKRISLNDGTSNFCELAGLTIGGEQIVDTVLGDNAKFVSENTVQETIQDGYTTGTFVVSTTSVDAEGTTTIDKATIIIAEGDSIANIIQKINDCGLAVNAYVDENTGKLVIERTDSTTSGEVHIQKGTSNFTNVIGFTDGGMQSEETVLGSTAELVSQNAASDAKFTEGTFEINLKDKDGNILDTHTFTVGGNDSASKIAQDITNAGLGLTAYIDATTNKMVIKLNDDSEYASFSIEKGTSDFTNVMGFVSGGEQIGDKSYGQSAILTSQKDITTAVGLEGWTDGTFTINGEEITISSSDSIDAILDNITQNTDVIASIDANGKIQLTLKANAGAEDIVVEKGTSNFTNKFGFTSGGDNNGVWVEGTNAILKSDTTSLSTAVSAGDFYINVYGENAIELRIEVGENATVASVMEQINGIMSPKGDKYFNAYFDSSTNQLVIELADEAGDGCFNIIGGTSDFAQNLGFATSGHVVADFTSGTDATVITATGISVDGQDITGDFKINITKEDGTVVSHEINIEDGDTIQDVIDKINANEYGVTASYDNATGTFSIGLDGDSDATSFEIEKGTSSFTNLVGLTSGGDMIATVVNGTTASINSSISTDIDETFSAGDFIISLGGNNAQDIVVNVDEGDTLDDIIDKINAQDGVSASYDETTGFVTITRDEDLGEGTITVNKGSSNFTNIVGYTSGGNAIGEYDEGENAELVSSRSATDTQKFTEGDFVIKVNGDKFTIGVTASDTIHTIASKINDSNIGVSATVNSSNKLVLTLDADSSAQYFEVIKGTSSFTNDIGLTSGGEEIDDLLEQGSVSKLVSNLDYASVAGAYSTGTFTINLYGYDGLSSGSIDVNIGQNNGVVDDIYTIMNAINSENSGITASLENGKLALAIDEDSQHATFTVTQGSSDFTTKIGLTSGGGMEDDIFVDGTDSTHSILSSQDLGDKIVSNSMTLGSIGVTAGTFRINGVDINVKTSDTIYDLATRINSVFSAPEYADIAVSASYENGELVLRTTGSATTLLVEKGSSNFTDIAKLTNAYQNSTDLGITDEGQNAHFNINGKDYDMALSLNENGENMLYLDKDGNVVTSEVDSDIAINIKKTGFTTIEIGRQILDDSVQKLQTFINRFNTAMSAAANPILSDDTSFISFVNKIKSALTSDVGEFKKITTQLAELGIVIKVTGGNDSNMGVVEMKLTKTNGQYDYVEAFYKNPSKVYALLIGDDSTPIDNTVAGAFTRLSNILHDAVESNRSGYFKVTPRSIEAQQKALKNEISSVAFDLNELKLNASGTSSDSALTEHLSELEKQYQLVNEAIANLNKQYSSAISRLILNQNNASFNPIV